MGGRLRILGVHFEVLGHAPIVGARASLDRLVDTVGERVPHRRERRRQRRQAVRGAGHEVRAARATAEGSGEAEHPERGEALERGALHRRRPDPATVGVVAFEPGTRWAIACARAFTAIT